MLTSKELNSKIDALSTKTEKWRDEVQIVLVACAARAFDETHRDVDGFTRLIHKLVGADLTAVARWIKANAPTNWGAKQDTPYGVGGYTLNKAFKGEFDAVWLLGESWWNTARKAGAANEAILFDIDVRLSDLIKRIASAKKKGLPVTGHGPIAEMLAKAAQVSIDTVERAAA